jgi:hypothetical protein
MQQAVTIRQFLGDLAIVMPSAVKTVGLSRQFPGLRADVSVTVVNPFYAKPWHVVKSTGPDAAPFLTFSAIICVNFRIRNIKNKSNSLLRLHYVLFWHAAASLFPLRDP